MIRKTKKHTTKQELMQKHLDTLTSFIELSEFEWEVISYADFQRAERAHRGLCDVIGIDSDDESIANQVFFDDATFKLGSAEERRDDLDSLARDLRQVVRYANKILAQLKNQSPSPEAAPA